MCEPQPAGAPASLPVDAMRRCFFITGAVGLLMPDKARGYLYIYNGGSSGTCNGIDVVRISLADVTDAKYLKRVTHGRAGSSCHDNNVLLNVGGTTTSYAMCAGGNGLAMYKFDLSLPADAEGGVERPTLLWSKQMPEVGPATPARSRTTAST